MRQLVYLASARRDLADIFNYIARESGNRVTGRRFVEALRGQCQKFASLSPMLGRPRPELRADIRSAPFKGYTIFFRYEQDIFEVVNILEGHRDVDAFFDASNDTS